MNIEFIKPKTIDWKVLKVGGKIFHEGHNIPDFIWMQILEKEGHTVKYTTISDEDMEEGNY